MSCVCSLPILVCRYLVATTVPYPAMLIGIDDDDDSFCV